MRDTETCLDLFAIQSFRDMADEDYIAARMAFSCRLSEPCLWSSQQAIEKYLKCILLLNRVRASKVKHDLRSALALIDHCERIAFHITPVSKSFIEYVDDFGTYRYREVSTVAFGPDLVRLDRTVWELRRYCVPNASPQIELRTGMLPPKIRVPGGVLEKIIDDRGNPAREPLLRHNAFFGNRTRRKVRKLGWITASNAPLFLYPQLLPEVQQYVHVPERVVQAYREFSAP
jgi:hypothetical protein